MPGSSSGTTRASDHGTSSLGRNGSAVLELFAPAPVWAALLGWSDGAGAAGARVRGARAYVLAVRRARRRYGRPHATSSTGRDRCARQPAAGARLLQHRPRRTTAGTRRDRGDLAPMVSDAELLAMYGACATCHGPRTVRRTQDGDTVTIEMVCSRDASHDCVTSPDVGQS